MVSYTFSSVEAHRHQMYIIAAYIAIFPHRYNCDIYLHPRVM